MLARQGGACCRCRGAGPFIAEHTTPVALGNAAKPDCLLCVPCAKQKTHGPRGDLTNIAKAKRLGEGRTQYDKRLKRGPKLKGAAKFQSRGFDKSLRKKMDGTVEKK